MDGKPAYGGRLLAMYALLGAAAILLAVGAVLATADHFKLADLRRDVLGAKAAASAVAGEQNIIALCEASITNSIDSNAGIVGGYSHPTVTQHGNKANADVTVSSTIYNGRLECSFTKSNWQIQNVTPK